MHIKIEVRAEVSVFQVIIVGQQAGRYEMELLLKQAGYRLENLYGSYDLEDFHDGSDKMIFVARS